MTTNPFPKTSQHLPLYPLTKTIFQRVPSPWTKDSTRYPGTFPALVSPLSPEIWSESLKAMFKNSQLMKGLRG